MPVDPTSYKNLSTELIPKRIQLIAVSKTKPIEEILELYELGHRDFGENYVQEMLDKQQQLPADIRWHFIGHLQTNKVKNIAPFVELIHGVDSLKLIKEINKQGAKQSRKIKCLFQVHIAREETKFGLDEKELQELAQAVTGNEEYEYVKVSGLMGMASFTASTEDIRKEFQFLRKLFEKIKESYYYHEDEFRILSMGMSGDYRIAIEEGSNMVRIGSLIFGERT